MEAGVGRPPCLAKQVTNYPRHRLLYDIKHVDHKIELLRVVNHKVVYDEIKGI